MKLDQLNTQAWSEIKKAENFDNGYLGTFITLNNEQRFDLLLFIDRSEKKHFVIEIDTSRAKEIDDPNINGLKVSFKQFRVNGNELRNFIDIECAGDHYLDEFTGIVKEISTNILFQNSDPVSTIYDVIETWKSFLSKRIKVALNEEEQLGLACELIVLKRLCTLNPVLALNSWKGPLREKHDFVFSDWCCEIKATRSSKHSHIINGIDQLKTPSNKKLAFISFLLTMSQTDRSISLQSLTESIVFEQLKSNATLVERFYGLLANIGYSRLFAETYDKTRFEILDCRIYHVDSNFPSFTSENLISELSTRISEIRYKIDLEGLSGEKFVEIQIGNYFY